MTLKEELGIRTICAVHINHGLRGDEADRDEEYSRRLARQMGAEFRSFHFDIAAAAKEQGVSSETAGRRARYGAFEQVCREIGAEKTAVAHNRNDQAETVLMRILRGTGVAGLSGIEYVRDAGYGKIVRPLLDVSREEIENYCLDNGLNPVTDSTNEETIYTRNKIRLELLPHLRKVYNPSVDGALVRLGRLAAEDNDYLASIAGKMLEECWDQDEKSISADKCGETHPAVMKRVIMEAAVRAGAAEDLDESRINGAMELLQGGKEGKEADLTHGRYVCFQYGKLWFCQRWKAARSGREGRKEQDQEEREEAAFPFEALKEKGFAEIFFCGRVIRLHLEHLNSEDDRDSETGENKEAGWKGKKTLRLDWEKLQQRSGLVFRHRRAGDRIRPRGMKGRKKLQDFFVDRKIPRHMRDDILLLADGSEIVSAGAEAAECCTCTGAGVIVSIEY